MFSSKKPKPAAAPPASSSKADKFDAKAAEDLFETLVDQDDPELISMEGIGKLCESLGLDPATDVRVLVLVWKLGGVTKPGAITKTEFLKGCQTLQVSSVDKMKALLPALDPGFLDRSEFRGTEPIYVNGRMELKRLHFIYYASHLFMLQTFTSLSSSSLVKAPTRLSVSTRTVSS